MRPLFLLLAAATTVGAASVASVWADPTRLVPTTRFTEGQFVNLALGARELPWPVRTDLLNWPDGAAFHPLLWPALPLAALFGPTLALNLVFSLLPAFNAACGYVLGRALSWEAWPCAALGGLLAWSAWTFNTLANGQLEQVPVGGAALMWAACARVEHERAAITLPALATLVVGVAAPHVALAGLFGVGILAVAGMFGRFRGRWIVAMLLLLPALAAVHGWQAPQFEGAGHVFSPKGTFTTTQSAAVVPGIFEVATPARLFLPPAPPSAASRGVAHCAYLGWVTLLAAGLAVRRPQSHRWLLIAGVLVLTSLGVSVTVGSLSIPLPAALFGHFSEALQRSANPYRLVLGAVVALSVAAASTVRGPWTALALVALAWSEVGWTRTRGLPLPAQSWEGEGIVAGPGPVLDLPLAAPECPEGAWHYVVAATRSDRATPLALSFDWRAWGDRADLGRQLDRTLGAPDCSAHIGEIVRRSGFTDVVAHEDVVCALDPREIACLDVAFGVARVEGAHRSWSVR